MSKVGKMPITLPTGVTCAIEAKNVTVTGPKGTLVLSLPRGAEVLVKDTVASVEIKNENTMAALQGTIRALLANMVKGVTEGFVRELELIGTGYRAEVRGDTLVLTVGFSHPVEYKAPTGITFKVEKSMITVSGISKELVGEVAAKIRAVRPPEPYKGKGIRYKDEEVKKKAGKAAKAGTGA